MVEPRIGVVYEIPPQPPSEPDTTWLSAGAITIGVEYRRVDPDDLLAEYADDPKQLAELLAKSPEGGFSDQGVSLHVRGTDDGHEYLRFDVFDDEPHYHYIHRRVGPDDPIVNNVVVFDTFAHGDMLPFAVACLRGRLPEMLTRAQGSHLIPLLDATVIDPVIDEALRLAEQARRNLQRLHTSIAGATP